DADKDTRKNGSKNGSKDRNKDAAADAPRVAIAGVADYFVVGQLAALQPDGARGILMRVAAGNRPVMVALDADADLTVASGDSYFCQTGDQVQLTGLKHPTGIIQAETVEVEGAMPLGGAVDAQARYRRLDPRGNPANRSDAKDKDKD